MPNKITNTQYYSDIANAIRAKNGSSDTYTPAQMAQAIADLPSGGGEDTLALYAAQELPSVWSNTEITTIRRNNFLLSDSVITQISLPNLAKVYGSDAFKGMSKLTHFSAPKLQYIGSGAFYNDTNLEQLSIPLDKITFIGADAFRGGLNKLQFHDITWSSLYMVLGGYAFYLCTGLTGRHVFPMMNTVQINNAFAGTGITHFSAPIAVTLGNSFTVSPFGSAGELIFADMGAIDGRLDTAVFKFTPKIKCIALRKAASSTASITWPRNASSNFNASSPLQLGTGYILVPSDQISDYTAHANWQRYITNGDQFLALEDYTEDGTATGAMDWDKVDALLA